MSLMVRMMCRSVEAIINLLISPGGIIVQINSMAGVGMDIGRESTGRGESPSAEQLRRTCLCH
jgi:hypothetical protein